MKDADTIPIELHDANSKVHDILLQKGFVFDRINTYYCFKKLNRNSLLSNSNQFLNVMVDLFIYEYCGRNQ